MVNLNPYKSTKYASILNCQTSAMAISTQPAFQKPSSLTRADVVAAAYNDLAASQSIQTIEHSTQSIDIAYITHLKALMRYELGVSLADYRDDDLVLLPHPHPVYLLAGELREGHGSEAEKVLRETQACGGKVRTNCCEECRFQANYKVPEKGNKAVVIKREDGEVIRTVNQPIAARKSGVQPVSALSVLCVSGVNTVQFFEDPAVDPGIPEGPQSKPSRQGFNPEAMAFTPKLQPANPNTTSPTAEESAFHRPPHEHILRPGPHTHMQRRTSTTSPFTTRASSTGSSRPLKSSRSSAHAPDDCPPGQWLTVGESNLDCERCGYVQLQGEGVQVHVQCNLKRIDRLCAVHGKCAGSESRRRCAVCLVWKDGKGTGRPEAGGS